MAEGLRPVWICEQCNWVWLKTGDKLPKRCPSRKCRSGKWNVSGKKTTKDVTDTTEEDW